MVIVVVARHLINYPMQELHKLDNSQLMDLLARHTSDYTQMMSEGTTDEEYHKCSLIIKAIQTEIDARKNNDRTNITPPPDFVS